LAALAIDAREKLVIRQRTQPEEGQVGWGCPLIRIYADPVSEDKKIGFAPGRLACPRHVTMKPNGRTT
jgi:hypothetical protein